VKSKSCSKDKRDYFKWCNGVGGESTILLPRGKHLTLGSFLKKGLFNK